ncbi:MAG TPA: alpha/beta fold hydrolase [Acidimicrobiia bacterium]
MNATAVELVAADGVRLRGRQWEPPSRHRASVVLVHGFGASSTDGKLVAVAEALVEHGHAVISVDSRGHGSSDGAATLGDDERLDVDAAVTVAGPAPVVVVGASMGAIGALRYVVGAATSSVAGIVTVSCPARWTLPLNARGVLSAALTHTPPGRWIARRWLGVRIAQPGPRPAPPLELVPEVGCPLALVHGRADPFIPVADAELLHAAAREPRRLELVDGMGHAFTTESIEPVVTAVDWVLAQE